MATGKALFNKDGGTAGPPLSVNWTGSSDADYVSVNYPAHALFTARYPELRQSGDTRKIFYQMLGGGANLLDADAKEWKDADYWTEAYLRDFKQSLIQGEYGVFSPSRMSNYHATSGNGDGFLMPQYLGDYPYGKSDLRFSSLLSALRSIPQQVGAGFYRDLPDSTIATGNGDDVILPGWLGNGTIKTGSGDDIILSSPTVYAFSRDNVIDPGFWGRYIFGSGIDVYYPIPYSLRTTKHNPKGNRLDAGNGNDLIYYDGGTKSGYGGDGDDIFAPSFGSFNWAVDTLLQTGQEGKKGILNYKERNGWKPESQIFIDGSADGISLTAAFYGYDGLLSPVTNLRDYSTDLLIEKDKSLYRFHVTGFTDADKSGRYLKNINWRFEENSNWGLSPREGDIISVDENVNILGGQNLYGGPGDDVFYGIDPGYYKGYRTAGDGKGLRLAFNRGRNAKGRQHGQIVKPVEMFGGAGSDLFSLGNPISLMQADRVVGQGYIYRISGNSDEYLSRNSKAFGKNTAPDIFEFNLTYEGDNWESTVVNAPGAEGNTPTAQDYVSSGMSALSAIASVGEAFARSMPIMNAIAGVGSFIASLGSLFTPEPKEPISTTSAYFKDPLGNWRLKTHIQDWDPSDAIVLRVDPSDPSSAYEKRWEQVEFGFQNSNDTNSDSALDIVYTTAKDNNPIPIIRLEEFNTKTRQGKGAWTAWNFNTGQREQIESSDLSFFGEITYGRKDIHLGGYEDEYGFMVPEGERIFRWTESSLNKERLSTMQSLSESIFVQLDTRKLGYYWDIEFTGEAENTGKSNNPEIRNLTINEELSKLWVKEPLQTSADRTFQWKAYSLHEATTNPIISDLAAKATPTWTAPTPANKIDNDLYNQRLKVCDKITGVTILEQIPSSSRLFANSALDALSPQVFDYSYLWRPNENRQQHTLSNVLDVQAFTRATGLYDMPTMPSASKIGVITDMTPFIGPGAMKVGGYAAAI